MASSIKVLESRFVQSCTNIANAPQISNAEIAILGRSNVGKSSLINALLNNKNLAKSSSTPGKTKLVNFFVSKWQLNSYQKNSSLGMQFRTCENFCGTTDHQSSFIHKNSHKYKSHTANTRIYSLNQGNSSDSNESSLRGKSTPFRHTERIEVSKSCESNAMQSTMTQKRINESYKFAQNQRIVGDSQVAKMDSSLRATRYAQNDDSVDCFGQSPRNDGNIKNTNSTNQTQKTIEGIAVEVAEFLPNFECETGLGVREHSKFGKSMQDAPKRELPTQEFVIHILDFPGFGYAKLSKSERNSWDKNLSTFLKKRESIKLFIHLIDSRHTNLPLDNEIRAFLRSIVRADADILEVFTKADKLKKSEIHALKGRILVSTTKKDLGQGDLKDSIESLRHAILRTMYHI